MANFVERIAAAAARFPDRTAIEWIGVTAPESTTYRALLEESAAVAEWLRDASIAPGDRVAILAANDARWVAAYLGILRLGAIAVPLDTNYAAAQVRTILTDSGARVLFASHKLQPVAESAVGTTLPTRIELLARRSVTAPLAIAAVDPNDAAVILYTSGTTADPKGVVLTHANLDAERAGAFGVVHVTEEDVVLGVLPLFHALAQMANLLLPLSVGSNVIFLEAVNSSTLIDTLKSKRVTIFACVPQFFYLIHERVMAEVGRRGALARRLFRGLVVANAWLRERIGVNLGHRLFGRVHETFGPRMRLLITGGSRFDPVIARDLYGLGLSVLNAYGLTETSGGATMVRPDDRFTTSVGQSFPGVEIAIAPREPVPGAGPSGDDPDVADGEILIRGPIVMREYYNRPEATAETLRNGWLHTGDLGRLDASGRLSITGRKKEIIVLSSGKNLYPEEIEAHYRQSPFVKELAVLGLTRPGEPSAERLHAVIVPDEAALRARGAVNMRELVRFELEGLSVALPAHKRILSYDISLEPLPRTTTGKLRRGEIEKRAERSASQPGSTRAVTPDEQAWLDQGDRADLIRLIAERATRATVTPDANLELDLGLDSMERVELLTALEDARGVRVARDVQATIFTVRQLVDAVCAARAGVPGVPGVPEVPGVPGMPGVRGEQPWTSVLRQAPDPELVRELTREKLVLSAVMYAILRLCRLAARLLLRLHINGRAELPDDGAFIVAPNHQTYLDGFIVASALPFKHFRRVFFVGASEYFATPWRRRLALAMNIVPVDADSHLVRAMQAAATGLSLGRILVLFPEGERSIDGTLKPFRKGAAILAGELQAPIVPAAVDGLFELWPRGRAFDWRALVSRSISASLTFGEPIRVTAGRDAESTHALQDAVGALLRRSARPVVAPVPQA